MNAHQFIVDLMPYSMGIAAAAAVAIGWVAKKITVRVLVEKVRRANRSVQALFEQLDEREDALAEQRLLVEGLAADLAETRRCLRSVIADPLQGGTHHITLSRVREVAARPLPGESTGTHAATEEADRG